MHIAILGLGPSLEAYVNFVKRLGGRRAFCDEVWAINAAGDVLACDRVFHMDDVRIQELRAAAEPDSNIAHMLRWLKTHPGPIYTSRLHPDYPGLVEYPLEDVINSTGMVYYNSTAAYAVAFAIHIGATQISLHGFDFTYASSHKAEKGRGCVEFYLGMAKARGIEIGITPATSLLDACHSNQERCYGYDTLDLEFDTTEEGRITVKKLPRVSIPTAAEIEDRYDHDKHPSPFLRAVA